jgi:hypothetical protein
VLVSQKRMVFFLTLATTLLHFLTALEMIWDCSIFMLIIKPIGAAIVVVGISIMRKMEARLHEKVCERDVTFAQKILFIVAAVVCVLMFAFPRSMVPQILELIVCIGFTLDLWYHYLQYKTNVARVFALHENGGRTARNLSHRGINVEDAIQTSRTEQATEADIKRASDMEKDLKAAKSKLQNNMTVGVLISLNVLLAHYILWNPIWSDNNNTSECALRMGKFADMPAVDRARHVLNSLGFCSGHAAWWHTILIFLASNKRKLKQTYKSKKGGLDANMDVKEISQYERSSVQM